MEDESSFRQRRSVAADSRVARARLVDEQRQAVSVPPSQDPEQGPVQAQSRGLSPPASHTGPTLPNWRLVMNGIHVFCGVPIYTMPYALRQGGWFGLVMLATFAILTYYTSQLQKYCMTINQRVTTYADLGDVAYGNIGRYMFIIVEFLLAYASCVESIIILRDLLEPYPYSHSVIIRFGEHGISYGLFVVIMFLIVTFIVALVKDFSDLDWILTRCGVGLTVVGVMSLLWIFSVKGHTPGATSFVHMSGLSKTFGFSAYAYAGHPYLLELYPSLVKKESYWKVVLYIYGASTTFYFMTASLAYLMFVGHVESIYLLSLDRDSTSVSLAISFVLSHQIIRFILGVLPMARTIDRLALRLNLGDRFRLSLGIAGRGVILFTAVYCSLVAPIYGPLMSFLGSVLGTTVALIIPCACYLRMKPNIICHVEGIGIMIIIVVSCVAAIFGAKDSFQEMTEVI